MNTPTEGTSPSAPDFPDVHGAEAATSDAGPGAQAGAIPGRPEPQAAASSWLARSIALVAVALAAGVIIGYVAKPSVDDTRFINFDAESTPSAALVSGWSGFEQMLPGDTFVWCASTSCSVRLQTTREGDRIVRVRLWPFRYPEAPPQMLTVSVNGASLGAKALLDGPSVLSFSAPRSTWQKGANELRLDLAYAEDPKSKYPGADDPRKLAAAFDWLEIATPAPPAP